MERTINDNYHVFEHIYIIWWRTNRYRGRYSCVTTLKTLTIPTLKTLFLVRSPKLSDAGAVSIWMGDRMRPRDIGFFWEGILERYRVRSLPPYGECINTARVLVSKSASHNPGSPFSGGDPWQIPRGKNVDHDHGHYVIKCRSSNG